MGVVGRDGGYTAQVADACVIVPTVNPENVTPHSEAFQAVVWHLLSSAPKVKANQTKWEFRGPDREPGQMKSRAIFLDRDGVLNHPVIREASLTLRRGSRMSKFMRACASSFSV